MMKPVRRLVVATMKYNIVVRCKHVPGKTNCVADNLSRFQFQEMGPLASRQPMCSASSSATHMYLTPDASLNFLTSLFHLGYLPSTDNKMENLGFNDSHGPDISGKRTRITISYY